MRKIYILCFSALLGYNAYAIELKPGSVVKHSSNLINNHSSDKRIYKCYVRSQNGAPLKGAYVLNQQTNKALFTDHKGIVEMPAKIGETLVVQMSGYRPLNYRLNTDVLHVIYLAAEDTLTKRQTSMLFGKVTDTLRVASADAVYTNELIKSPVASIYSALTGRLSGLYTSQSSGLPGSDGVSLQLRGQAPLVVVDGIPRSITLIDPEEIESVTVLKDALATAMLGVRGGQGALLITTRKGQAGKQRISFTAQSGVQQPLKLPTFLNAYDYSRLYNEAIANEALRGRISAGAARFSDADLEAYRTGSDPIGHPDINWQDQLLRTTAPMSRYNLNISGGSKTARYFVALESFNQDGLFKENPDNRYSTNADISRYIARSNVDIDLNDQTSLGLRLFGRIMNGTQPGGSASSIFSSFINTPNNAYPIFNADGSLGGTQQFTNNLYAQAQRSGYQASYNRDVIADLSLTRKLDSWLKGLWIRGLASFDASSSQATDRSKPFAVYQSTGAAYQKFGADGDQVNSTNVNQSTRQVYTELALGYTQRFGRNGIDLYVNANRDDIVTNSNLGLTYAGFSGKLTYDYNKKYVAEAAFGLNRSNRYPKGQPLGFFPAVGLAWNLYEESFMKNFFISDLKLSSSYGKSGWDQPGYFVYNQYYTDANTSGIGYVFGTAASTANGVTEATLANPNITWEKSDKFNIALSGSIIKRSLSFNVEYFHTKYYDLLMQPGRASAIIGNSLPDENLGINLYTGMDIELQWQQHIGNKFSFYVDGNASLLKSKVLYMDEVFQKYDWMKRTGQAVGQPFGYQALGLYQTTNANSVAVEGYHPIPGDIQYKDLNNDGVINQYDQAPIGSTKPLFFYGVNVGFSWGGLDFSALIQGVKNRNLLLSGNDVWEFQNNGFGQAYQAQLNRWTPATAATATYPSLSIGQNPNNQVASSFWMRSGDYLRLKTVELGYTFSGRFIKRIKLENIRVFANALNLFTKAAYGQVDPEVQPGSYPIQRVINGGITIKF